MPDDEDAPPSSLAEADNVLQSIESIGELDRLRSLRDSLATLERRAHAVSEQITSEMKRLGIDKVPLLALAPYFGLERFFLPFI